MENKKRSIWRYGLVKLPLEVGSPAWYCRDGFWRKTEEVEKIIETASDYLIFESKHYRYCFEYQRDEGVVLCLAA